MLKVISIEISNGSSGTVHAPQNSKFYGVGSSGTANANIGSITIDVPGEPDFRFSVAARSYMLPFPIPIGECTNITLSNSSGQSQEYFLMFEL